MESFLLLKFLVVYETQNLKTDWKMTQNKKRYFYDVIWEEKMPISEVSEFSILPYTWNRKLGNLGKFSFTYIFGSIWNSKSKNWLKNSPKWKTLTLCVLRRKDNNFRGFRVFNFALYLKSKTWKPRKVFIYFKFLSFPLH